MPVINFFKGHPSESLLPSKYIVEATSELLLNSRDYDLDSENRHPLSYGADAGALWVRNAVAEFNNRVFQLHHSVSTKPEYINLTGGASYGVMNVLAQTTLPHTGYTKQAFIITPTYFLINETFLDAGFGGKVTAIDEYENGTINLELLEERLEYFSNKDTSDHTSDLRLISGPRLTKKVYKFVLYCIPTFSNPGGQTYTLETRLKLIELARKYDLLIITDDVYDLLDYTQSTEKVPTPEIKRLTHLDRETCNNDYGNTLSNATFSKLIAPGLRFGYQESVNDKLAYQLSQGGANVSGGTPSQLNSMITGTILQNGSIDTIINSLRETYASRANVLRDAIDTNLPEGTKAFGFGGGYFIWVTLPDKYDVKRIIQELKKEDVVLAGGESFEVVGDTRNWGAHSIRLSISYLTEREIIEGVEIWGQIIKKLYKE